MRLLPTAPLLVVAALIAAPALADLGPPPKCSAGEHHQYLYGHHCVPDGFHLEAGPGGVTQVRDGATGPDKPTASPAATAVASPSASPATTAFASPPAPAPTPAPTGAPAADPSPVPPAPPASRGCACTVGETGAGLGSVLAGVAGLVAALRRRRPR